jgi:glyoxylase-like metal-dependent hydrolase (beta-lactamase superfamily II)
MSDAAVDLLARLGIWRLPIPTPFADVTVVNLYVVADLDGGVALVDTGADDPASDVARRHALASIGLDLADVRRIVVTHGHADHYGAAQSLAEAATDRAVPVLGHPGDFDAVDPSGSRCTDHVEHFVALLARHGTPSGVIERFVEATVRSNHVVRPISRLVPLQHGDLLRFRHFSVKVLHLPGHTRGLICLHDEENGLLFANDHLLKGVTPYLRHDPGPAFEPLVTYAESMARTRDLEVRLVLPGHGRPFEGHREEIDRLFARFADRQRRVLAALERGPATAFAVADQLSPDTAAMMVRDVVCMTVAHLEALERRGMVTRRNVANVVQFQRASAS